MSKFEAINTDAAPAAIGPYSQAIKLDNLLFLSGQIPLDPLTMELVPGGLAEQANQVFKNLRAVISASGATSEAAVKLTIYMTDLSGFPIVNEVMATFFSEPYPARATIEVSGLPKGALVEVDAIVAL
jgi:reactive intermediate/imine deaminase